jgi:hypothetical protein
MPTMWKSLLSSVAGSRAARLKGAGLAAFFDAGFLITLFFCDLFVAIS